MTEESERLLMLLERRNKNDFPSNLFSLSETDLCGEILQLLLLPWSGKKLS